MKTEITVSRLALIGTIVTAIAGIVVALITHFAPSKPDKPSLQPPPSSTQSYPQPVIQGNQGDVTILTGNGNIKANGDVVINNAPTNEQYVAFRKIIQQQDWDETKNNPAFRKLVRACNNGKNEEQLDKYSKAVFWEDLLKYLNKMEVADANYQQVKQGTVSEELKALYPKIDQARNDFNYAEVNRLLQAFEEKYSGLVQDAAKFCYLKAQNYELQINYPEAERYYRKAAAIEDQDPFYLNAHAKILRTTGKYLEAEPLYRRALAIREKQLATNDPDVASSLNNLALLLQDQGKYSEAEPILRRALAIREKKMAPNDPYVASSLNNLAKLLQDKGKYPEAEPLFRRALAIYEKLLGHDHPYVATGLNNLAALLYMQGKYTAAEPLFRRALAICKQKYGSDHPLVASSLNNLAILLQDQGKYSEAEPLLRRSLAIREKVFGTDHPWVATGLCNLAVLLKDQGKYVQAEPLNRRALAIDEKALGTNHPAVAIDLYNLALLQQAEGNYAAAEPLYRRALAIHEKALGPNHPTTIKIRNNLNTLPKP